VGTLDYPSVAGRAQDRQSSLFEHQRSTTVLCNQPKLMEWHCVVTCVVSSDRCIYLCWGGYVFVSVCFSVSRILKKLWMKIFWDFFGGRVGFGTVESCSEFGKESLAVIFSVVMWQHINFCFTWHVLVIPLNRNDNIKILKLSSSE